MDINNLYKYIPNVVQYSAYLLKPIPNLGLTDSFDDERIIKGLSDKNENIRAECVYKIGLLVNKDDVVNNSLSYLAKILLDKKDNLLTRMSAGTIYVSHLVADDRWQEIVALLRDKTYYVKQLVLMALNFNGEGGADISAVSSVYVEYLQDKNDSIADSAVQAIGHSYKITKNVQLCHELINLVLTCSPRLSSSLLTIEKILEHITNEDLLCKVLSDNLETITRVVLERFEQDIYDTAVESFLRLMGYLAGLGVEISKSILFFETILSCPGKYLDINEMLNTLEKMQIGGVSIISLLPKLGQLKDYIFEEYEDGEIYEERIDKLIKTFNV